MVIPHHTLNTDLYQLTMSAAYFEQNINHSSTFELFVRKFPENRSFMVASGIEHCLQYLTSLSFSSEDIAYLKSLECFNHVSSTFWDYLREFKFTGDVEAIEEGTIFFPGEPVLTVTAPAIEAQIVETYLLAMFNFQTLISTKAARINLAAQGKPVIDFGTRRAHSPLAGVLAARAAYIGGCSGTSNVLAGKEFGLPVSGTMAHSWVMSHKHEKDAFDAYSRIFPESNTLLIDTYDTVNAAKIVSELPYKVSGVRLDSGDLLALSKQVRYILDNKDRNDIKIVVSGDLNEYKIQELLENDAPIDIFGVGTELVTSKDAPALAGVYKLVQQNIDGKTIFKAKFSDDKQTYPAKKQVYRFTDSQNNFQYDIIALNGELDNTDSVKLLKPVMKAGKRIDDTTLNIAYAQNNCLNSLSKLPEYCKQLQNNSVYPVKISAGLEKLSNEVKKSAFSYV
ncbi:MAG: nicotinate phosphoribosyltransferase [Vampirovibrionia bacterium]